VSITSRSTANRLRSLEREATRSQDARRRREGPVDTKAGRSRSTSKTERPAARVLPSAARVQSQTTRFRRSASGWSAARYCPHAMKGRSARLSRVAELSRARVAQLPLGRPARRASARRCRSSPAVRGTPRSQRKPD
jgi:hypothetical protein